MKSARLYFERLNESHLEKFIEEEMDSEVMAFIRPPAKNASEARLKYDAYLNYMFQEPQLGVWTIFDNHTKEQLGMVVLFHFGLDRNQTIYEVGYRLRRKSWGQGFATEATRFFLNYAFKNLGLTEIYAVTKPENEASRKVLLKAGLQSLGMNGMRQGCETFSCSRHKPD